MSIPRPNSSSAPPGTRPSAGTLIPLYTRPTDPSWAAVIAGRRAHPRVSVTAVVNPASGPGPSRDPAYTSGIAELAHAGVVVIGYVATGHGARANTEIQDEIGRWKEFYPDLGGIFFDEQATRPGLEHHYRRLGDHAKDRGLAFTVGNPGTNPPESYAGIMDVLIVHEKQGVSTVAELAGWHVRYPAATFGVLVHGTAMNAKYVRAARAWVGHIYLTDDQLPNPWDTLPSYYDDLLAALE